MRIMKSTKQLLFFVPIIVVVCALATIGIGHVIAYSWVGEQPETAGYFQKTVGLITDAPHATAELFFATMENLVILIVGFNWGKYRWRQEHKRFDAEHNIKHD